MKILRMLVKVKAVELVKYRVNGSTRELYSYISSVAAEEYQRLHSQ